MAKSTKSSYFWANFKEMARQAFEGEEIEVLWGRNKSPSAHLKLLDMREEASRITIPQTKLQHGKAPNISLMRTCLREGKQVLITSDDFPQKMLILSPSNKLP